MNELQNFDFNNLLVRTVIIENEPWFVGKDVAEILGYSNTKDALLKHVDAEDKQGSQFTTSGQKRVMTIVNESGLYNLIIGAAKQGKNQEIREKAQRFKRWITQEVLPQIRKTGSYQSKPDISTLSPELQILNQMTTALTNTAIKQERQKEELQAVKNYVGTVGKSVDNIAEIVALNTSDWRKQSQAIIRKIAYKLGAGTAYQEIGKQIYEEVERTARCSLKTRLTNMRKTMALEGASKSYRDKKNYLDVIEKDPKLIDIYMHTVKQFAIKYQVQIA